MKNIRFQILPLAILLILMLYFTVSSLIFVCKSDLVKAKITKTQYYEVTDRDSSDWYSLDIIILSNRKTITNYYFETGLVDPEFKAGQIVELYYNSKDPLKSEVKNFWVQWGPPILIVMILIFYLLVMYIISVVIKNKKKKDSLQDLKISE